MQSQNFTSTFMVQQTPAEVFEAINYVSGWWTGEIEGETNEVGDEFTYRYPGAHYSKQKVTELVPGKRVAWRCRRLPPGRPRGPERMDRNRYHLRHHLKGRWDRGRLLTSRPDSRVRVLRQLFECLGGSLSTEASST